MSHLLGLLAVDFTRNPGALYAGKPHLITQDLGRRGEDVRFSDKPDLRLPLISTQRLVSPDRTQLDRGQGIQSSARDCHVTRHVEVNCPSA